MRLSPASFAAAVKLVNDRVAVCAGSPWAVNGRSGQNRAVCVWSAVRVVLVALPSDWTWARASAYAWLVRAGGPAGRNSLPEVMANGVTFGHCGSRAGAKALGVGCQSPGFVPGV